MGTKIEIALEKLNQECDKSLYNTCKIEWNLIREQYQYTQQNLKKYIQKVDSEDLQHVNGAQISTFFVRKC